LSSKREYLEYIIARRRSEEKIKELLKNPGAWRRKYVVVCNGEIIGFYDELEKARSIAKNTIAKQCIIVEKNKGIREEKVELSIE